MKEINNKKGFTLIELLVVISIIGLLSSVVLAGLTSARKKAQAAKFVSEMNQLKTAFELYRNDKGSYPSGNQDDQTYAEISAMLSGLVTNQYISSIPQIANCPTACYTGGVAGNDYGYITNSITLANQFYKCGGVNFKAFLFYIGNSQISPNYPVLNAYPNYYCFGQ